MFDRVDFNADTNRGNARFFPLQLNIFFVVTGCFFIVVGAAIDGWLTQSFPVTDLRDGYVRRGFWSTDVSDHYGVTVSYLNIRKQNGTWWDPFCSSETAVNPLIAAFDLLFPPNSLSPSVCCGNNSLFLNVRNDPRTDWCSIKLVLQVLTVIAAIFAVITFFTSFTHKRSTKPVVITSIITGLVAFVCCCVFASIFFRLKFDANDLNDGITVNGSYSIALFVIGMIACAVGGAGELIAACSPRESIEAGSSNEKGFAAM
eukprot:m.152505 g.152505  ORF g.152505 m.152505 type:complete len:259 (+) comp13302_c1_seq5:1349-2125(+)